MSRISAKRRKHQIKVRQKRREKLAKLRQQYLVAKTREEKEKIWAKVQSLAPWLSEKEFLLINPPPPKP